MEQTKEYKSKLHKLIPDIKEHWRVLFIIEAIFFVIMIMMGIIFYHLTWQKVAWDAVADMRNVRDVFRNYVYDSLGPDVDTLLTEMLCKLPGTQGGESETEHFAIAVDIYDENHNLVESVSGKLAAISFQLYDEINDISYCEWYDLNDYFDEKELEALRNFYFEEAEHEGSYTVDIQYVKGYYDDNEEFIPVEILFYDLNSDAELKIGNTVGYEANHEKEIVNWYMKDGTGIIDTNASIWINNSSEKCLEEIEKVNRQKSYGTMECAHYVEEFPDEFDDLPNGYADIVIYADISAIIFGSYDFIVCIVFTVVLLQLCAMVLMWVYVYFQKKQKELSESRDIFVNAMAHELKTPVAVVQNTSEYLQTGSRPEKQEHYLDMLQQEATHMNRLLNDMLTYTRVSDTSYHLQLEKINIKEMISEVLDSYADIIQEKKIRIDWKLVKEGTICCDLTLMKMVVDNLFSNAIKYGGEDGIIRITIRKRGFSIYNSGSQLSEEDLSQVWSPMYRVDTARTADGSSGMGLAISAGILKQHKATYRAENVENGVEFYVSFEKEMVQNQQVSKKSRIISVICNYAVALFVAIVMIVFVILDFATTPFIIVELMVVICNSIVATYGLIQIRKRK